jgi:hypothetical protein
MTDHTDLLTQARAHPWWYSDQNLATQLIDQLTIALTTQANLHDKINQLHAARDLREEDHQRKTAEIERLRSPEPCWWVHADSDFYESQCGGIFQFTDGGPHDNAFSHCPFCGKPLMVGVQEEEEKEEDGDE